MWRLGVLCAPYLTTKPTCSNLTYFRSMLRSVLEATRLQLGRKLQTLTFCDKHALRQTCIELYMEHRMTIESCKWRLLQPALLAQLWVLTALLSAMATPAFSSQGTPEQRMACTPDVFRLCSAFIPNADEITICLREKNAVLSDACRAALAAGLKQPPNESESTQSRRRTTK